VNAYCDKVTNPYMSESECRERPTDGDFDETVEILNDFGSDVEVADVQLFTSKHKLLAWRSQMIDDVLSGKVKTTRKCSKLEKDGRGRPRKATVDDLRPYHQQIKTVKITMSEKRAIADSLSISVSTVDLLIREIRTGTR